MNKYEVVIKRIEAKRHYGFRYEVEVYQNSSIHLSIGTSWSYTFWGTHHVAKKLIKKYELPKEKEIVIKKYEL